MLDDINKAWDLVCKFDINWMGLSLAIGVFLLVVMLWRFHTNSRADFDITDLIKENDRVSKIAFAWVICLLATTWVIMHLALKDRLTEGYFAAYLLAWVGPLISKILWGKPPGSSAEMISVTALPATPLPAAIPSPTAGAPQ